MKKIRILRSKNIIPILLTFNLLVSFSQQDNTMYYMELVPQSHHINPATQPQCSFYFGIPAVSPVEVNFENSAFSFNDVMWFEESLDSTISFLHPVADKQEFLDNFGKANYISTDIFSNILSIGVRAKEMYFTFDLSVRSSVKFIYPGDLMEIPVSGLPNNETYDLSSFGVKSNNYAEIALGASRVFSDIFTAGMKAKILFGAANINTRSNDISLYTSTGQYVATSVFEADVSVPGMIIESDENGEFSLDSIDVNVDDYKVSDYMKNKGFAIDLGVHYKPVENLTVSASIIDLGFIRWKNGTYNIIQDAQFTFEGIDYNVDNEIADSLLEALGDSISDAFVLNQKDNRYTSFLNTRIYLGAKYNLTEYFAVGLLSRSQFVDGKLRQQLTLSGNCKLSNMLSTSLSWSVMNRTLNNFGFGLSFRIPPLNIYLISDNLPLRYAKIYSDGESIVPLGVPYKARTINLRIGLNFMFGCDQTRRLLKDKPLFY